MSKDVDKGGRLPVSLKDVDSKGGAAPDVVTDIIGRAAELGGWLIVSFIAPVPPSPVNGRGASTSFMKQIADVAKEADQRDTADSRDVSTLVEAQKKAVAQLERMAAGKTLSRDA